MKTTRLLAVAAALALLLTPGAARALDVHVDLVLPGAPALVMVQPGVEVVEGYGDEVFVHGGFWWLRRGPVWYRAARPGARFMVVREGLVPPVLYRLPPGRYRHYRAEQHERRREWRQDKKEERRERMEDRREVKERRKDEQHGHDRDEHDHH